MTNGVWILSVTRNTASRPIPAAAYTNREDAMDGMRRFIEALHGSFDETRLQGSHDRIGYTSKYLDSYYPAYVAYMTFGDEHQLSKYILDTLNFRNQKAPDSNG